MRLAIVLLASSCLIVGCEMFQPIADGAARGAAGVVAETPSDQPIDGEAVGDAAAAGAQDAALASESPYGPLLASLVGLIPLFLGGKDGQ